MIIGLCDRFHKLPSEVLEEDARVFYYIDVVNRGRREEVKSGG